MGIGGDGGDHSRCYGRCDVSAHPDGAELRRIEA